MRAAPSSGAGCRSGCGISQSVADFGMLTGLQATVFALLPFVKRWHLLVMVVDVLGCRFVGCGCAGLDGPVLCTNMSILVQALLLLE